MKPGGKTDQRASKKGGAQPSRKRTPLAGVLIADEIETQHSEQTARDWDAEQAGGDAEAVHQEQRPMRHDPVLEDLTEDRE